MKALKDGFLCIELTAFNSRSTLMGSGAFGLSVGVLGIFKLGLKRAIFTSLVYVEKSIRDSDNDWIYKNSALSLRLFASKGAQHPFKRFIPKSITENFKMLYGFYWGVTGHFFITLNDKIEAVSDLKGERIGLGSIGQSDLGMNPTLELDLDLELDLEYGYGISFENTHPGAIRAFKELGWWDLRNDFSPIKLPKH